VAVTAPVRELRILKAATASPLLPVDLLLLGYLAVVSAVALARVQSQPDCGWLLVAHLLFGLLLYLITRPGLGRVGRAVREIYPLLLLPGLYTEIGILNGAAAAVHDALVQRWEIALFGGHVSREWWQAMPSTFWSTVLHGAYFSYYLIVPIPAFYFVARGNRRAARRFVLAVVATFLVCYLAFIFFPVAGPYYMYPAPAAWFTDNVAARLVYDALASGSSYGAAFPSSHVAATVAAAVAAARGSRRLGLLLATPTVLLTVAVVYCQMHYAVDAAAGLLVGLLVPLAVVKMIEGASSPDYDSPATKPPRRHSDVAASSTVR
jgi:membrane-associated phospholipid phosphatase